MQRGTRMIDGREYQLAGRTSTKAGAQQEGAEIRRRGRKVRIIKFSDVDYRIYQD